MPVYIENLNHVLPKREVLAVPMLCTATFGEPMRAEVSLRALAAARSAGVLPSHYDRMDAGLHARRLARLAGSGDGR